MKSIYIGIDLGTTNSAISTYDGVNTTIRKSPEQNDVTPSAIYMDKRGNKYLGQRAIEMVARSPEDVATLFKRKMGTSTPIEFPSAGATWTPEQCSAELLKTLFGYLPEDLRQNPDTGTVITVPAAFNQMQKNATEQAAEAANLGSVALMQEPVAAVMSVMRVREGDGLFMIYDMGGGTLDIAIAQSLGGKIDLLSHGGIAMCGGRDFDRLIKDRVVRPWLHENYNLPDSIESYPDYQIMMRQVERSIESAKIELSAQESANITLSEAEANATDMGGEDIYINTPLQREVYNDLIADRVMESVKAAREAITEAGLKQEDLSQVVFVGGPTHYKPLRDKVAFELGLEANIDVNPMTAVAEGASIFAESIDWSTQNRSRKSSRGQMTSHAELGLSFKYESRVSGDQGRIVANVTNEDEGDFEFQVDSIDTGWTSGRMPLKPGSTVTVPLAQKGDNAFKVFVFDHSGNPMQIDQDKIIIKRSSASISAIPASNSIGIEVLEKLDGTSSNLAYLVKKGDSLPMTGEIKLKAAETLNASEAKSLNFKLWEGDIETPITDNRLIGTMKVWGDDFEVGCIRDGDDLLCEYEMLDSGAITLSVSVPSIGATFKSDHNFYSPQDGYTDYSTAKEMVTMEISALRERIKEIRAKNISDAELDSAWGKLDAAESRIAEVADSESIQEAMDKVYEVKRSLWNVRKTHLQDIRQLELDHTLSIFNEQVKEVASPSDTRDFVNLSKTAQRSIDKKETDFERQHDEMRGLIFHALWQQDGYVVEMFRGMASMPHLFIDQGRFEELVQKGLEHLRSGNIDELRQIVYQLHGIRMAHVGDDEIISAVNIRRG